MGMLRIEDAERLQVDRFLVFRVLIIEKGVSGRIYLGLLSASASRFEFSQGTSDQGFGYRYLGIEKICSFGKRCDRPGNASKRLNAKETTTLGC